MDMNDPRDVMLLDLWAAEKCGNMEKAAAIRAELDALDRAFWDKLMKMAGLA